MTADGPLVTGLAPGEVMTFEGETFIVATVVAGLARDKRLVAADPADREVANAIRTLERFLVKAKAWIEDSPRRNARPVLRKRQGARQGRRAGA